MPNRTVPGFYYCHKVTEIIPGLFLSGYRDAGRMAATGAEVLIPLAMTAQLPKGCEILPCHIRDGGCLPEETLREWVERILGLLAIGRTVGLFCVGGHGRTGYLAACVLGRNGFSDPIAFLRDNYCSCAVETWEQLNSIAAFLEKPELAQRYRDTVYPYCRETSDK